jgi:hypothetical protein
MTDTTTTSSPSSAPAAGPRAEVDKAFANLVTIGRLWATHGVEIGLSALETSAESLRIASETLATLKDKLKGEPESDTPSAT